MCVNHIPLPIGCSSCMKIPSQSSGNFQLLLVQVRGKAIELLSTAKAAACALKTSFTWLRTAGIACFTVSGESKAIEICITPIAGASPFFASLRVLGGLGCMKMRGSSGRFSIRSLRHVRTISDANSSGVRSTKALLGLCLSTGAAASEAAAFSGALFASFCARGGAGFSSASAGGFSASALALRIAATAAANSLPRNSIPSLTSSLLLRSSSTAVSVASYASGLRSSATSASARRWYPLTNAGASSIHLSASLSALVTLLSLRKACARLE
mmetsp:Transcript_35258/g.87950  ORF Transcript_35258/g.87950 Transcript_35258/m.87950 type:complete len:271 (+) Transcript_35258:429-1241(+)